MKYLDNNCEYNKEEIKNSYESQKELNIINNSIIEMQKKMGSYLSEYFELSNYVNMI